MSDNKWHANHRVNEYGEVEFTCVGCGKDVIAYGHKANQRQYCSQQCCNESRRGRFRTARRKRDQERKDQLREWREWERALANLNDLNEE